MADRYLDDLAVGESWEGSPFTITEAEIIAFCRGQLPGFKTPKAVVFGPLPKTSTGKIQKFELRKRMQSDKAIDV